MKKANMLYGLPLKEIIGELLEFQKKEKRWKWQKTYLEKSWLRTS